MTSSANSANVRVHKSVGVPLDPGHEAWRTASQRVVELLPQSLTLPSGGGGVKTVEVRALHDDEFFAVRLAWAAPAPARTVGIRGFRDSCAIMFPALPGPEPPFFAMGAPGQPVILWQWKPDWERPEDQDQARLERYPEYADYYNPSNEALWKSVGDRPRVGRANVLVAEGFGTATRTEDADLEVESHHTGEQWNVVFRHRKPSDYPRLVDGGSGFMNFAAWNGAKDERGARKSLSYEWQTFGFEGPVQRGIPAWASPAAFGAAATAAGIAWIIRRRMRRTREDPPSGDL